MTTTGYSNYKLNGVSLQTYRWNLESLSGLESVPARRGANLPTPYQDGDYSFGDKFLGSRTFTASMLFFGQDADGNVNGVDGPRYNLQKNLDDFKALCHANTGLQVLSFDVADGVGGSVTRQIDVEVLVAGDITRADSNDLVRRLAIEFTAPRPLWREMPLIQHQELAKSSFPYGFSMDTAGNAFIGDAVITIDINSATTNPSLAVVSTGDIITVNDVGATSDQYVLDIGSKTFTKNGVNCSGLITRGTAWFMRLPPSATLAMTLDATSGNVDLTVEYYKKWL